MRRDLRVLLGGAAAGAMMVAMSSAAYAQAPSPVREEADEPVVGTVEEVIVTARRVTESLQEVPIPVSAFSGKELEEARAFTPEALTNQVPNLKIFKGAGNSNTYAYYIRGVGRDIGYFYAEAPVSLYVDDVFYPYQAGPVLGIGGIDHAEVLRGPQGTLYGKNATVGTVKIFHKHPNPNAEDRELGLTVGSYGRFEAQASQNIPLIDGKLAFRADMGMKYYDGFIKDLARNDTVGGIDTKGGRFGLTWTPNDRDEVYLAIDASSSRDEVHPWTPIVYGPGNLTVFPRFDDRYVTESYMPNINMLDTGGVTLQGRTEVAGVQLRSISSYRGFHQEFANDNGASVTNHTNWNDIETHDNSWSQEFVASGAAFGDRLTYVGGLFYFDSTTSMRFIRGSGAEEHTKQRSKSAAAYVDGSFEVLEGLNVSAGVRYTRDAKEARQTSWNAAGTQLLSVPASDSWNATTWKVGADYQVTDNVMAFVSWGTGYKGGGLSTGQPTVPSQVFFIPPEFATNKEIGIKSDWFDRRLRVNLNYFDTDYEDMIQTILNQTTLVSRVAFADAKIKGFEWDITAKPTSRWTITFKGATLDAKNVNVEEGFPAYNWEDKTLKHAPDLTYNIGTSYDLDLYGGVLTLAADYEWLDDMYESLARDISTMGWAYDLLNLRVAYEFANPSYQLVLDATNVLDEEYFKLGATRLSRQYGPPTEVSLSFRYRM